MASPEGRPLGESLNPAAVSASTNYCPKCGSPASGRFCASCGNDLELSQPARDASVAAVPRTIPWGGVIIVIGGSLAALGSFLPWLSASAPLVGTVTKSGLDGGGDGIITLILGVILALAGVAHVAQAGPARVAAAAAFFVSLGLGLIAFKGLADVSVRETLMRVQLALEDNMFADAVSVSAGMGLYVVIIGAVFGVVGAVVALRTQRSPSAPSAPGPRLGTEPG